MIHLMYVDDDPAFLELARIHFTTPASTLTVFAEPDEALTQMQQQEFHAVISDLAMPRMNGLEFLAKVKESHPKPYRILISGSESRKLFPPGLPRQTELSFHYFFHKPFTGDDWKRLHGQVMQKVQGTIQANRTL